MGSLYIYNYTDGCYVISTFEPVVVESELKFGYSHKESSDNIIGFYKIAAPDEAAAGAIAYAIQQHSDVVIY